MTMLSTFHCLLAFVLAIHASAQEPSYPSGQLSVPRTQSAFVDTAESAEFAVFIRCLQVVDEGDPAVGPVSGYRLAWVLSEHGGMSAVTRGDGSAPASSDRTMPLIDRESVLSFRTAEGKRGLSVVSDTPCGLICRTTWYYVEE